MLHVNTADCNFEGVEKDILDVNYSVLIMVPNIIGAEFTEKDFDRAAARLMFYEKAVGPFRVKYTDDGPVPMPFTMEDLIPFKGMTTNWCVKFTTNQFAKRVLDIAGVK